MTDAPNRRWPISMSGIRRLCWLFLATWAGMGVGGDLYVHSFGYIHVPEERIQEIYCAFAGALFGLAVGIAIDQIFKFKERLR